MALFTGCWKPKEVGYIPLHDVILTRTVRNAKNLLLTWSLTLKNMSGPRKSVSKLSEVTTDSCGVVAAWTSRIITTQSRNVEMTASYTAVLTGRPASSARIWAKCAFENRSLLRLRFPRAMRQRSCLDISSRVCIRGARAALAISLSMSDSWSGVDSSCRSVMISSARMSMASKLNAHLNRPRPTKDNRDMSSHS
jgi:hypothetical protein